MNEWTVLSTERLGRFIAAFGWPGALAIIKSVPAASDNPPPLGKWYQPYPESPHLWLDEEPQL